MTLVSKNIWGQVASSSTTWSGTTSPTTTALMSQSKYMTQSSMQQQALAQVQKMHAQQSYQAQMQAFNGQTMPSSQACTPPQAAILSGVSYANPYGNRNPHTLAILEAAAFADDGSFDFPTTFAGTINLPDGGKLIGDGAGTILIEDKDAKVRYRAAEREFNRYLNSSDLMEEFIAFAAAAGANKRDILGLPLNLFITFLIIRAAESDGEEPPDDVILQLPKPKIDRCGFCGRFLRPTLAAQGLIHCNTLHFDRHMQRLAA